MPINNIVIVIDAILDVEHADLPFPEVQRVADVEELLFPVQLELVQERLRVFRRKLLNSWPWTRKMYPTSSLQPRTAQKMSWNSASSSWSDTATDRMTIGLMSRSATRRTKRLKDVVLRIPQILPSPRPPIFCRSLLTAVLALLFKKRITVAACAEGTVHAWA
jgi:hypothetical protein